MKIDRTAEPPKSVTVPLNPLFKKLWKLFKRKPKG